MKVGLGLGSNVGDRLLNLQRARNYLRSLSTEQRLVQSPVYESEPLNCPAGSGKFLNAVVEIEFTGTPRDLLAKILGYELSQGRDRSVGTNGPRTVDIDILYFGNLKIAEPDLVVPHPRMEQRRFVMLPLSTIRDVKELPVGEGGVRLVYEEW
jgi:2-amino-4-hydroxy-6-hydroxymethyldihydropteridine diphosphokinase